MKNLIPAVFVLIAILSAPLPLPAQPAWTNFTYTDWSPGEEAAISALSGREAFDSSIAWDGERFVAFFRGSEAEAYLSAFSSDGQEWEYLRGGDPVVIADRTVDPVGDHAVAAAPDGFPPGETAWEEKAGSVRFKLWFSNSGENPGESFQYAESTDGHYWRAFPEGEHCPPSFKNDTYRVLSRPSVLYRPRGSGTLETADDRLMNNRYLMYLQSGLDGEPHYYELYTSSNGLDWTLAAADSQSQTRGGFSLPQTISFSDGTPPGYLNTFEEVYEDGSREGWMFWGSDGDGGPVSSWRSQFEFNGWSWIFREEPIDTIGEASGQAGTWNEAANARLSSVRLGTSYFFLRTGKTGGPEGVRQLGAGIKKGLLSVEIDEMPPRIWGDTLITYRLFSWNNQTCPKIDPRYLTVGVKWGEPATQGAGGDPIDERAASIGGTPHTFMWSVNSDLATRNNVRFRIYTLITTSPPVEGENYTTGVFDVVPITPSPTPTATPTPEGYQTPPPTATPSPTATPAPTTTPPPTPSPTATPIPPPPPTLTPPPDPTATPTPAPERLPWIFDYNGDGTSDFAIFRPAIGLWAVRGVTRVNFGGSNDIPVPGDYSGDGTTDIAIYRPGTGLWAVRGVTRVFFGGSNDIPVPGDYSGGGTWAPAIFRPATGLWAVRGVTRVNFGSSADKPVPGYYSGRGEREIAIFRPATGLWAVRGGDRFHFGGSNDIPVPGDYSGDGTWTPAIYRPATGLWAALGVTRANYGTSTDQPVPGDYPGAGRDRIAIFRDSTGLWAVRGVTRVFFGRFDDIPVAR